MLKQKSRQIAVSIAIQRLPYLTVCKSRFRDVKTDLKIDVDLLTGKNCNTESSSRISVFGFGESNEDILALLN